MAWNFILNEPLTHTEPSHNSMLAFDHKNFTKGIKRGKYMRTNPYLCTRKVKIQGFQEKRQNIFLLCACLQNHISLLLYIDLFFI